MADKNKSKAEENKGEDISYSGKQREEKETKHPADEPIEKEPEAGRDETEPEDIKPARNWTKIFLVLSLIGNVVLVAILFYSQATKIGMFGSVSPTPTPSLEITNPPTPTLEEVNLEAYKIGVQNGSGIAREGAKVKETLEKAGFKVSAVGNADNSDYTETIITVSEKIEDGFIDELTKVLEERGSVGKIEKFAKGEDGEVLVIIGSDLKKASPTPEE